jgi:lysophospholipase L1-like esterase
MFPRFLKPEIVVANYAESGESLLSFKHEKRLQKLLSQMKAGDFLFIEFAHNDQKPGGSHLDPFTTYKAELKNFIAEARKMGGKPVLVTSMHRRRFDEKGKVTNTLDDFPEAMRQAAREENVPLIDLNAMSKEFYEAMGPENSNILFPLTRCRVLIITIMCCCSVFIIYYFFVFCIYFYIFIFYKMSILL